jgi:hypothetical protein
MRHPPSSNRRRECLRDMRLAHDLCEGLRTILPVQNRHTTTSLYTKRNPKPKILNSKQIQNPNVQNVF